jgi:hypothetical protein
MTQMRQSPSFVNRQQSAGMKGQLSAVPVFKRGDVAGLRVAERAPTAAVRRNIARVIPSFLFMDVSFPR